MPYTCCIVQVEYVDASVYNCVLDVCMNNAETELAETIFQAQSAHVWHRLAQAEHVHVGSTHIVKAKAPGDGSEGSCDLGHLQHVWNLE